MFLAVINIVAYRFGAKWLHVAVTRHGVRVDNMGIICVTVDYVSVMMRAFKTEAMALHTTPAAEQVSLSPSQMPFDKIKSCRVNKQHYFGCLCSAGFDTVEMSIRRPMLWACHKGSGLYFGLRRADDFAKLVMAMKSAENQQVV